MRGMGRKQPQEDFLRNMVGNDEIVNNHAPMHQPNNMYRVFYRLLFDKPRYRVFLNSLSFMLE